MTTFPKSTGTATPRRIYGLETEYGLTCTFAGQRRLTPDEVARYLFRRVVSWGRSSNVFLINGARLYLDVGSHPEYATAECADIASLIAQDKAGERICADLVTEAQTRLAHDGIEGDIYLFKNNTDSAGNSYGSHENYLIPRQGEFSYYSDSLIPFLISRQLICGAGKVLQTVKGTIYSFSQRAEHIWEGTSSATTRSRPIINTRDEPHADAERFRRLHVIVGDSNMSQTSTMLKIGSTELVLQLIETAGGARDLAVENPIRAIREISYDLTGSGMVKLADGRRISALDLQQEYYQRSVSHAHKEGLLEQIPYLAQSADLWRRTLEAIASGNYGGIDREIDWAIKLKLLRSYLSARGLDFDHPRAAHLDLAYHDINIDRGLYYVLERRGLVDTLVPEDAIVQAKEHAPTDTRARLRGEFIKQAQLKKRDFTVDWVHLKLNDQGQRTVLCKDPFRSEDERVQRLINSL